MSCSGGRESGRAVIAACMKWVDRRPEVDPLTGEVHTDARTSGASDADEAALEWALRIGEAWNVEVVAVSAGPAPADAMLRDAVAAGAARAVRVDIEASVPSNDVAASICSSLFDSVSVVVCGAWSIDRGSGSVPAFLAARLDAAQALGLVSLSFDSSQAKMIEAERRLDRGRRERLRVTAPAVISVEGGSIRLRRATLDRVLAARSIDIDLRDGGGSPFRPRHRSGPRRSDLGLACWRPRRRGSACANASCRSAARSSIGSRRGSCASTRRPRRTSSSRSCTRGAVCEAR